MKTHILLPLAALALLSACDKTSGDAPKGNEAAGTVAAPAGTNWAETVSETTDGGFMMGNPNAPVKLVEYGSYTCSHCGEFAAKGIPQVVENYVKTGKVSFEYRSYVRDPFDVVGALTTRCGGSGPFFQMSEQMFAEQASWMGKLQGVGQDQMAAMSKLPPAQQFAEIAKLAGFDKFALERGIPAEKLNACFADKATIDKLVAMRDKANTEVQLTGTPTFLINGEKVIDGASWEQLEPKLRAALGS